MKYLLSILLLLVPSITTAGSIDGTGAYNGQIKSVAAGFWGHVGVELDLPVTEGCSGHKEAILLTTNPLFKEVLTILIAAQSSQQQVTLYHLSPNVQDMGGGYSYCIVTGASLGSFSIW